MYLLLCIDSRYRLTEATHWHTHSLCNTHMSQTMSHITDACTLTKFDGGLQLFQEAEDDAIKWLESIGVVRGCSGCTCTPRRWKKNFSGL